MTLPLAAQRSPRAIDPFGECRLAGVVAIAVVRGRDTIAVKGYGKANLELGVATPPNAIYEIGSVTKQFTGAAIMQLVQQGSSRSTTTSRSGSRNSIPRGVALPSAACSTTPPGSAATPRSPRRAPSCRSPSPRIRSCR
ncbi:MAG: serine hydrolase [Gemmatimonadetes bacterium]|nr:serine hydrolase [Gemmatimonadota bacterium]